MYSNTKQYIRGMRNKAMRLQLQKWTRELCQKVTYVVAWLVNNIKAAIVMCLEDIDSDWFPVVRSLQVSQL